MNKLWSSRKWVVGCLYVAGVFACNLAKAPLSPEALMWTGVVITTLIGAQAALDHKAGTGTPDGK